MAVKPFWARRRGLCGKRRAGASPMSVGGLFRTRLRPVASTAGSIPTVARQAGSPQRHVAPFCPRGERAQSGQSSAANDQAASGAHARRRTRRSRDQRDRPAHDSYVRFPGRMGRRCNALSHPGVDHVTAGVRGEAKWRIGARDFHVEHRQLTAAGVRAAPDRSDAGSRFVDGVLPGPFGKPAGVHERATEIRVIP